MKQNLKQTARERFAAMTLFLLICLPFSLMVPDGDLWFLRKSCMMHLFRKRV